jgi:CRISPR-associated endoribonuclease Cas6
MYIYIMRLLVKLKSLIDSKYEMQYHYYLQSFIYDLLKGSKFHYLHDKQGYKFFCFSNIFPVCDFKIDDRRVLIIS